MEESDASLKLGFKIDEAEKKDESSTERTGAGSSFRPEASFLSRSFREEFKPSSIDHIRKVFDAMDPFPPNPEAISRWLIQYETSIQVIFCMAEQNFHDLRILVELWETEMARKLGPNKKILLNFAKTLYEDPLVRLDRGIRDLICKDWNPFGP
jgi:hypothetical protein